MTTFTWTVTQLEAVDRGELHGVCTQACFDVQGEHEGKQGFAQGDTFLGEPDPDHFAPIAELTHDEAVSWVKSALGERVAEFEARVQEQIDRQMTPQPKAIKLPWEPEPEPEEEPDAA